MSFICLTSANEFIKRTDDEMLDACIGRIANNDKDALMGDRFPLGRFRTPVSGRSLQQRCQV